MISLDVFYPSTIIYYTVLGAGRGFNRVLFYQSIQTSLVDCMQTPQWWCSVNQETCSNS